MKELFLLGAGASVEAEIPNAIDMTKRMLDKISSENQLARQGRILRFVIGGLLFQQGIKDNNPYDGINIEELFNAVSLLAERQISELGPFVGSWHPQLNELDGGELSSSTNRRLIDAMKDRIENAEANRGFISGYVTRHPWGPHFGEEFSRAVREVTTGGNGRLFAATAETMITRLVEMVWIKDSNRVKHLVPLVQYAYKNNSSIVTLNYDNTIELAGKSSNISIGTGFESWSETGEFGYRDGQVPLIKLHGSVDWKLMDGEKSPERPLPYKRIVNIDPDNEDQKDFRPAVVFGGKNKLTAEGPFLSLLRAFENKLSEADQLTVIGYSFRDDHVNEFIANWFNGKLERKIGIIDLSVNKQNGFIKQLDFIEGKNRVQFVDKTKASQGILDIVNGARDCEVGD